MKQTATRRRWPRLGTASIGMGSIGMGSIGMGSIGMGSVRMGGIGMGGIGIAVVLGASALGGYRPGPGSGRPGGMGAGDRDDGDTLRVRARTEGAGLCPRPVAFGAEPPPCQLLRRLARAVQSPDRSTRRPSRAA